MKQCWHLNIEAVAEFLQANSDAGLSVSAAEKRISTYGYNQLTQKKGRSPLGLFLEQFQDFIIWVLIVAALVSGFLKEWVDALAIIAIVIINAILGFIQEYRAQESLAALKKLSAPNAKVIRDNQHLLIPSREIVPGDLIELESGDNIPADSRLIYATPNFSTQEASLTGESTPVAKTILALEEKDIPLADRANMVYMGTSVAAGKARALVIETGMRTELGKIAVMIQDIEKESTPLQKKLEQFGKWIVMLCFILVGLVFLLEFLRGGKILDVFLTAVSLAVAAIPEGLPAVVTIALALGVQRMVKRHALIRKLPSVETLGCATVICSDKTGTLTKNEMTVRAVFVEDKLYKVSGSGYETAGDFFVAEEKINPDQSGQLKKLLIYSVLCNGAQLERDNSASGDPTEIAMLVAAAKAGVWKVDAQKDFPFIEEIPFDSERKKMTIVRRSGNKFIAFVKGAAEELLDDCSGMDENYRDRIIKSNADLAAQAMRVLGVAYRELEKAPSEYSAEEIERELTFLGLVAMIDPPRTEVKLAIQKCRQAGIRTVMITGDHKNTAVAIAKELGFFSSDSFALTGDELDDLSDEELFAKVRNISVYARVSPQHKLRIVQAWRRSGEIVAMTGDGVNDAPAVKEADIGVAMGITGTDVTKEVSDMVVTDDNFASIVSAVEEGRGIYDNIKKFVHYLLSCNTGEILVMFVASLIGWPVPLLPVQILWVNLVTDGLPALALGVDPVEPGIMNKPPRMKDEAVVTKQRAYTMLAQGSFIAFCSLLAFCLVMFIEKEGIMRARTAAFVVLSCSQLFHAFNCRSDTESIFKLGFLSNKKLICANLISFIMQMAVVYVPFLQRVFQTQRLGFVDWLMVLAISSLPLWLVEISKRLKQAK